RRRCHRRTESRSGGPRDRARPLRVPPVKRLAPHHSTRGWVPRSGSRSRGMRFVRIFGPSLLMSLTLTWTGALAQQQAPATTGEELVDRVVAVVGDTILLASDVQAELLQLRASGQLGNDPAQIDAAARQILDSKVNDLILVSAAR